MKRTLHRLACRGTFVAFLAMTCISCSVDEGACAIDLRTSGVLDVTLDKSELTCRASFASSFLDMFFETDTAMIQVEVRNIAEGDTGTFDSLLVVEDRGRDWRSVDCTVKITLHDAGQVKGVASCPSPLEPWTTNDSTETLSVEGGQFSFASYY